MCGSTDQIPLKLFDRRFEHKHKCLSVSSRSVSHGLTPSVELLQVDSFSEFIIKESEGMMTHTLLLLSSLFSQMLP
jgi:hypothetical protein